MEEIIPRVGELSSPEFGTKEPILDTSIKNQESDEIMGEDETKESCLPNVEVSAVGVFLITLGLHSPQYGLLGQRTHWTNGQTFIPQCPEG